MSKVALLQMVSSANIEENLKLVELFMIEAREAQAELVVLPENYAFMGINETDKLDMAEFEGQGPIQDTMRRLAKKLGLWVIAGTMPIKSNGSKVRASCMVYDDKGLTAARYDKIHLFDVRVSEHEAHQESLLIERGNELVVVSTPVGKIGLTVCYDLRFPELFQKLIEAGAELITVPSAFTAATGIAHWEVLLRARAIENLCYIIAPNQGGQHENGRQTYGHSMVVEPWGKIIAQKDTGIGMLAVDIELQHLQKLRKQFPCIAHHVLN